MKEEINKNAEKIRSIDDMRKFAYHMESKQD